MPVTSSRRYSSSYLTTPSSTLSSSGGYRSNYSSYSSTTTSSSSKDLPTSTSRYNFSDTSTSYRPTSYRSSLTSGISSTSGTTGSYRPRYDFDDDKYKTSSSSSLSTRIGVSKTSRFNSDTLPPLPPTASSSSSSSVTNNAHTYAHSKRSLSRSRDLNESDSVGSARNGDRTNGKLSLMNDLDFYEKYSPSRYMTKYEISRSRSLSEAAQTPTRDKSPASSTSSINNDTPTHTPRSEIRSVALRNALPTTTTSNRSWDRDYSTGASLYSGRSSLGESKSSDRNGSSYAAGGFRASNVSPSKSPSRDSSYNRKGSSTVEGQTGLWNIGNTCFMNSVLQCLSHTFDLSKFSRSSSASTSTVDKSSSSSAKDQKIWSEFCKLLTQMWQPGAKSVNPSDLKMALSCKYRMYGGSAQQDAQEFLRYLLEALHGALNTGGQKISLKVDDEMSDLEKANVMWDWYTKRENSKIKDLFVGQLKSSLHCTHCEKTSVMYDPFWDLSVPVPSSPNCKLDKCLEMFVVKDVLDGNEMPYCDYCKTNRKCIKGFTIQRFPKYLVIHLKRFSEMRWTKLTNIVEFPTGIAELDLTPYASESMDKNEPKPIYSLYGISNHMGSTHGGHYVASCKHPVTKKWFEYNDNFVSETRESSLVSSSAYLLFYERV